MAQDPTTAAEGIASVASAHGFAETVEKLKAALAAKGIRLFALVDHSGEAEKAGLTMPPTQVLIFGSPKAGTPLMLAAPSLAIDLPLRILVHEDADGKVWLAWNTAGYLAKRHGLAENLQAALGAAQMLAEAAAQ